MFYEEKEIRTLLKCDNCKVISDEQRVLPCGFSICLNCIESIQYRDNTFECMLCFKKHFKTDEQFPVNRSLERLRSIEPSKIYRSEYVESLKISLDHIKEYIILIKFGLNNSNDQIKEHCMNLKSDIQLKAEQTIQQINDLSEQFLNEIDEYEKKCIISNNIDENKKYFDKILDALELFHTNWSDYICKANIKDEIVLEANKKANQLCLQAEKEKKKIFNHIFNGNMISFNQNLKKLNQSCLGTLSLDDKNKPILNDDQMNALMTLCEFKSSKSWNLIYKATIDGFGASDFHQKCDNKKNTFLIIKSLNGNVFGGYTEQSWSDHNYKHDKHAFIFSYINKSKVPLKLNCIDPKTAIICNSTKGPIFGNGFDLFIENDSNLAVQHESNLQGACYSYIGKTYTHPDYIYRSNEACNFLAGSYRFITSEIEAYILD